MNLIIRFLSGSRCHRSNIDNLFSFKNLNYLIAFTVIRSLICLLFLAFSMLFLKKNYYEEKELPGDFHSEYFETLSL